MTVEKFVEELFDGVTDKAGVPYIKHCEFVGKVSRSTAKILGLSEEDQNLVYLAGLCHDVLEDTDTPEEKLVELIGERATEIVKLVSHPKKFNYEEYLGKILEDKLASIVKYSDSTHNSMITRFPEEEWTDRRKFKCDRYRHRAEILWESLTK